MNGYEARVAARAIARFQWGEKNGTPLLRLAKEHGSIRFWEQPGAPKSHVQVEVTLDADTVIRTCSCQAFEEAMRRHLHSKGAPEPTCKHLQVIDMELGAPMPVIPDEVRESAVEAYEKEWRWASAAGRSWARIIFPGDGEKGG